MSEGFLAGRRGGSKTQARLNRGMEDSASGRVQRQASGAGVQPGTGRQPLQELETNLELEPHLWPTHRPLNQQHHPLAGQEMMGHAAVW